MKYLKKIPLLFFLILMLSCGFQPVLNKINASDYNVKSIKFDGDRNLSFFLKNNLKIKADPSKKDGYRLILKILDSTESEIKNNSGITTVEQVRISILLTIKDKNEKLLFEENFSNYKSVNVSNDPSYDNEIKNIEKKNITLELINKIELAFNSLVFLSR